MAESEKHVPVVDVTMLPSIDGLKAPVEIRIDRWGVPHIRASNLDDLLFAQGFNAARDRLWQIDLARKRGLGLLAADFGPGFLAQDRAARLSLYRGDMEAEWASYAVDAQSICSSLASGINAYIDLIGREPWRLPPEFAELGTRPAKWAPEDVVRIRTHALLRDAPSEVLRARSVAKADADADLQRTDPEPRVRPHVAEGLDLGSIPLSWSTSTIWRPHGWCLVRRGSPASSMTPTGGARSRPWATFRSTRRCMRRTTGQSALAGL